MHGMEADIAKGQAWRLVMPGNAEQVAVLEDVTLQTVMVAGERVLRRNVEFIERVEASDGSS